MSFSALAAGPRGARPDRRGVALRRRASVPKSGVPLPALAHSHALPPPTCTLSTHVDENVVLTCAAFCRGPDDTSIYVDANTRIQILDTMMDLPTADKEQRAAFIVSSRSSVR